MNAVTVASIIISTAKPVIFGIEGKRVESLYDRDQLKLGAIVYVWFSQDQEPEAFSPRWSQGAIEYGVKWIATSEWYVALVPQFRLRPEFAQRIQNEIGEYISRAQIDAALATFVRMVRLDRLHQTAELGNNPLSVVFTILDRLHVCRRLQQYPPHPPAVLPFLDDPLVSYLYLTCFDRLGQPADWMDFGAWLKSSRCKDERDAALKQASDAENLIESMKIVYRQYVTLYGVKSSFFRFLHKVLPPDILRELLGSIDRWIMTNPPDTASWQALDDEKEKYLFKRRNDYTHRGDFRPSPGEWFGGGITNPVQEHHATYWTSTRTVGWPDILEKAVRAGLARYLLATGREELK